MQKCTNINSFIYIYTKKMFKCMFDRHWYARTPRGRLPEACKSNQRHLYFVQLLLEGSALLWHTSKIANSVSLNIAQDLEGLLPRMHETLWVTGSWMWTQIQTDHNYIYVCVLLSIPIWLTSTEGVSPETQHLHRPNDLPQEITQFNQIMKPNCWTPCFLCCANQSAFNGQHPVS